MIKNVNGILMSSTTTIGIYIYIYTYILIPNNYATKPFDIIVIGTFSTNTMYWDFNIRKV